MGTDKYKKDWYCVCGGLQDIRRTGTGCVEDCGSCRGFGSVVACRVYKELLLDLSSRLLIIGRIVSDSVGDCRVYGGQVLCLWWTAEYTED